MASETVDGARRPGRTARRGAAAVLLAMVVLVAASCMKDGAWTTTFPDNPPPSSGADRHLVDVSCPSPTACVAVGWAVGVDGSEVDRVPILQTWNGNTWTTRSASALTGPYGAELLSVSCSSPTSCFIAVNKYFEAGTHYAMARWNGTSLVGVQPDPVHDPEFPISRPMAGCASDGSCLLFDGLDVFRFDGTSYTTLGQLPTPEFAISSLSCSSITNCIGSSVEVVEHWNGSAWTSRGLPAPAGQTFRVRSTRCTSPTVCLAVGFTTSNPAAVSGAPAAAKWDGATWVGTPVPVAGTGSLDSVSCATAAACMAVGSTVTGSPGTRQTVALTWDALTWFRRDGLPGNTSTVYPSVSCTTLRCMAVGWQPPLAGQHLVASSYAWTDAPSP